MKNVKLFVVLYDGNFMAIKTSLEDAIRLVYSYEFEQEFASAIAMGTMPKTAEIEAFIEKFNEKIVQDDQSTVYEWWKIIPVSLSDKTLNFISCQMNSSTPVKENSVLDMQFADYDEMSAETDCDDIWKVGGSI